MTTTNRFAETFFLCDLLKIGKGYIPAITKGTPCGLYITYVSGKSSVTGSEKCLKDLLSSPYISDVAMQMAVSSQVG